jgi:hypothetical protein
MSKITSATMFLYNTAVSRLTLWGIVHCNGTMEEITNELRNHALSGSDTTFEMLCEDERERCINNAIMLLATADEEANRVYIAEARKVAYELGI